MARQVQFRRGSTADHEAWAGVEGEVTVDTDLHTLRVHDGETLGGFPLAKDSEQLENAVESLVIRHIKVMTLYEYALLTMPAGDTLYIIKPPNQFMYHGTVDLYGNDVIFFIDSDVI